MEIENEKSIFYYPSNSAREDFVFISWTKYTFMLNSTARSSCGDENEFVLTILMLMLNTP